MTSLYGSEALDPSQEIASWDQIMAAQAPAWEAPIQYTSSAEAFADYAPPPAPEMYAPAAQDVWSYAEAAPAPDPYTALPEYYGPPAPVPEPVFELPVYTPEDYALPEYTGSYTSSLTPYDASPDYTQVDPSVYQQFGFGTTGSPEGLTDEQAAAAMFGDNEGNFFGSKNPQFVTSDAQFDYTTDPANRDGVGIMGGLVNAAEGYNEVIRTIPGWSEYVEPSLEAAQGFVGDAASEAMLNFMQGQGYSQDANRETFRPIGNAAETFVPTTPLGVTLELLPGIGMVPGTASFIRKGGFGAADNFVDDAVLAALPSNAIKGSLQIPQYADEAADLARRFPELAGQTPIPKRVPSSIADQMPFGIAPEGAGIDEVAQAVADTTDEFAGNIRLSKFPEQTRPAIADWASKNADLAEQARRGVIPDAEVTRMAQQLVEDTGGDWSKLKASWAPGKAYNAEEIVALSGSLAAKADEVLAAARAAQLDDSAINQARLVQALTEQADIQRIVHGAKAEAGRALRANRQIISALNESTDAAAIRQALDGTGMNRDQIADVAKLLTSGTLDTPAKVNAFIRNVDKPNFWDKLHFYWINSILSGPITQTRNLLGNASTTLYSPVQRFGAAMVEQPLAAIQGRQAQRFWQEAPASVVGIFQGIPEGVHAALTMARTGISPRAAMKLDLVRPAPIGGIAGKILGAPTTALGVADEFFSAVNYRAVLNAEAVRAARKEGLRGTALRNRIAELVANPPANLMKRATDGAEELVFRGDTGNMARALAYLRTQIPGGRYILPFLNTPANLLKYGIKNSPLGLLDVNAWKKAAAGNPEGADELSRAFIASAVAASVSAGVATGAIDITAAAPVDPAERDRFFREGKIPFGIKLPGVGWVEYKSIPVLDTTLTLVASATDGVRRGEDVGGIAAQAVTNIATNLLDKSYMSGLGDLFDAIQDPARYAERYATRQASGFVPFSGATRQATGFTDDKLRAPEGFTETIKSQIPGLSESLPARLDAFGREIDRSTPSPLIVSQESQSAVDAELERVGVEVGFVGKTIAGVKLSREEQYVYQAVAGQVTYKVLEALIASPAYDGLTPAQQQEAIEKAINKSREKTREKLEPVFEQRRSGVVK